MSRSSRRPRAAQSTSSAPAWSSPTRSGAARSSTTRYTSETGRPADSGRYGSTDPAGPRATGSGESGRHSGRPAGTRSGRYGAGAGSGDPGERSGAPRRRTGSRPARPRSEPRPAPVSELEQALTASLDAPAGPADFTALRLPQGLLTGLQRRGIDTPFPIQARTLPDALAGRDMLGRAETGSGKTLAFGLPMLARLTGSTGRPAGTPAGLVLVPTRELAGQVQDALAPLGQPIGVRVLAIYGGASMGRQISALRRGVDMLVATPGRLLDLIRQGECSLG